MEWISVNKQLPGEGRFLCIVKFFEIIGGPEMTMTRPNHLVMEVDFDPMIGWDFKFCPSNSKVLYWTKAEMSIPDAL